MASVKGTNRLAATIQVPENIDWLMINNTENIVIEQFADQHPIGRTFKTYIPFET